MKAIRIHKHGSVDVLKTETIRKPQLKSEDVLVRVFATSLNHLDLWVRKGLRGIRLPLIPGSDASGRIVQQGSAAKLYSGFKTGEDIIVMPFRTCDDCTFCNSGIEELCNDYKILGESIDGTHAQFLAVPYKYILPKPKNLTWDEAAAFPLAYMTAYHMLTKKIKIQPHNWLLIWGASSGVGSAAIQIAKFFKANIIAIAGTAEKQNFARQIGADFAFNYHHDDIVEQVMKITHGAGVNFVFEHVGQASWPVSQKSLAKGGAIITCGATTGPVVRIDLRHLFIKHQKIIGSTMGNRQDLLEVTSLMAKGNLKPNVARIFHFSEIATAHRYFEGGKHLGKVVISFIEK